MAFDRLDVGKRCPLGSEQLVPHRHEMLGDDVQPGVRQKMVNVGDAAGDRIFDRDHAERDFARADRCEGVLEGRARHRFVIRIHVVGGEMGIRSRLALEHDLFGCHGRSGTHAARPSQRLWRSF